MSKKSKNVSLKEKKNIKDNDNKLKEDKENIVVKEEVELPNEDVFGIDDFNRKTTFGKILTYLLLSTAFVAVVCLFIYTYIKSRDDVNRTFSIISMGILTVFTIFFMIQCLLMDNKKGRWISSICSILLIGYSAFTVLVDMDYLKLPTQEYVPNFTGRTLTEVVNWSKSNNITLNQVYETSDLTPIYSVISQDVDTYTLVKNIDSLTIVVSEGPNYDKEVVMPSFIGRNVDDLIKFINDNYLTGVNIDFKFSDEVREIILTQDNSGQIKRNDTVNFTASLGLEEMLEDVNMIDLSNKSVFDATLFLKRYGIKYELVYEYSDDILKEYVIGQDREVGKLVNYKSDIVKLTVSKGPKIKVPNLLDMTVDEITNWVVDNHLKIEFNEDYDEEKVAGTILSSNVKEGDTVEQGSLISIVISKGQLRMEKFTSAAEFRDWADRYNVNYKEEYEFNSSVSSGNIIKSSHNEGDVIKNNDTVIIYVSQGKSIEIPNFVGKSKSDIEKSCKSVGLNCSFKSGSYSNSVSKDVATAQSKKAGSTVASGTSIQITLSLGAAKSYNVVIQSSWLSAGDADSTIATLKSKLTSLCPGVTFNFTKKKVNTGVGLITQDSPTKGGNNTFTQGKTYTFYIGS